MGDVGATQAPQLPLPKRQPGDGGPKKPRGGGNTPAGKKGGRASHGKVSPYADAPYSPYDGFGGGASFCAPNLPYPMPIPPYMFPGPFMPPMLPAAGAESPWGTNGPVSASKSAPTTPSSASHSANPFYPNGCGGAEYYQQMMATQAYNMNAYMKMMEFNGAVPSFKEEQEQEAEEARQEESVEPLQPKALQRSTTAPASYSAGGEAPTPSPIKLPPLQELPDDVPSRGSMLHPGTIDQIVDTPPADPVCRPCAWFYKQGGCKSDRECTYCHLCQDGELKARKKLKVQALRAGETPKSTDTSGLVFKTTIARVSSAPQ